MFDADAFDVGSHDDDRLSPVIEEPENSEVPQETASSSECNTADKSNSQAEQQETANEDKENQEDTEPVGKRKRRDLFQVFKAINKS